MIGIVLCILTLRAWLQSRATTDTIAHEHGDLKTSTEHVPTVTEHARLAAKKAVYKNE